MTLFLLLGLVSAARACEGLEEMNGHWTAASSMVRIASNGEDPYSVDCKSTDIQISASGDSFSIQRCGVSDCTDGWAFACDTETLSLKGDAIWLGDKKVGACDSDGLHFTYDTSDTSFNEWSLKFGAKPELRFSFNYWNIGTIESAPILLKR